MTNVEAVEWLKSIKSGICGGDEDYDSKRHKALEMAIKALEAQTEVNIYDIEETYHNCTVQVLTNTVTGQTSVGWWKE